MKKVIILFVLCFVSFTYSQSSKHLDSLTGHFALQFQLGSNFNLESFDGSTFSSKYNINKHLAIRTGISFSYSDESQDSESFSKYTDQQNYDSFNENEGSGYGFRINTAVLFYAFIYKDVAFYTGGGPFYFYSKSDASNYSNYYSQIDSTYRKSSNFTNNSAYSLGVDILAGVEWFVSENISLSAEYGINFYYYNFESVIEERRPDNPIYTKNEQSRNGFKINSMPVKLGVTVYF